MAATSKIEWTDASWNPIRARTTDRMNNQTGWHCVHVSEGCRNCYAETMNKRLGTGLDYKPGNENRIDVFLDEKILIAPLRWKRPRKIFVGSMTDLFADFVTDEMLDRVIAVMALASHHTFQVLTKRPERMRRYFSDTSPARSDNRGNAIVEFAQAHHPDPDALCLESYRFPLPNVWLGASVEDQPNADARIPKLLAVPARVHFLSCEPLLSAINLRKYLWVGEEGGIDFSYTPRKMIDWVICGGESGPHARPMHPDWARSLRDQCAAAGVPFHFKQWGEWLPWQQFGAADVDDDPEQTKYRTMEWEDGRWNDAGYPMWCQWTDGDIDDDQCTGHVGKKAAGRLLDGIEHNGFPEP